MVPSPTSDQLHAVWVNTVPRNEADALVRFLTPEGALTTSARGMLKPSSKLAPLVKPGDELSLTLVHGRGSMPVLAGVVLARGHPAWQLNLDSTALCWTMTEYAALSTGDDELNQSLFQLVVNLLRSEPEPRQLPGAFAVYSLRLLSLHGVMLDLVHCAYTGAAFTPDEPVHLLPTGDGLIGREAYNANYARHGGGMPRISPQRLAGWQRLSRQPLLDYRTVPVDTTDCALLLHLLEQQIARPAGMRPGSGSFIRRQWALLDWKELCTRPG